jgi:hypothetical protein
MLISTAEKHHAHRVQPPDKGHDDGGKAVARRHIGRELAHRPGHLQRTGQAGRAARDQQRRPQRRRDEKPA